MRSWFRLRARRFRCSMRLKALLSFPARRSWLPPFDRVEDIIRSVAGIYNYRHYALQTRRIASPLKMRGVGEHRILVLVDGVPQNDNFNDAIAWVAWGHIPKEVIQRIEIVRGPASAVYGSEGLGGVINIITKKPKTGRQTLVLGMRPI
ncbi:MAG: hypothetical protein DRH12_19255 [Deltaproteobacteria bacterium]|nr:MAG: hypothetical protein DRH12_19255 [Deltaproteobacteria bacterium]